MFFPNLISKFLKYTGMNDPIIELIDGEQLFYRPIYTLELIKLETLKVYIKTNLANNFIRPFKDAFIIFNWKSPNFSGCVSTI